jgi:hypothetical protein
MVNEKQQWSCCHHLYPEWQMGGHELERWHHQILYHCQYYVTANDFQRHCNSSVLSSSTSTLVHPLRITHVHILSCVNDCRALEQFYSSRWVFWFAQPLYSVSLIFFFVKKKMDSCKPCNAMAHKTSWHFRCWLAGVPIISINIVSHIPSWVWYYCWDDSLYSARKSLDSTLTIDLIREKDEK